MTPLYESRVYIDGKRMMLLSMSVTAQATWLITKKGKQVYNQELDASARLQDKEGMHIYCG